MKTFQEALETCAIAAPKDDPEAMERAIAATMERAEKYIGILKEAADSESIVRIIESLINECDCPENAMFSALSLGLQIGMEMEKCERCRAEGELALRIAEAQS